jgi:hypothetical protein
MSIIRRKFKVTRRYLKFKNYSRKINDWIKTSEKRGRITKQRKNERIKIND